MKSHNGRMSAEMMKKKMMMMKWKCGKEGKKRVDTRLSCGKIRRDAYVLSSERGLVREYVMSKSVASFVSAFFGLLHPLRLVTHARIRVNESSVLIQFMILDWVFLDFSAIMKESFFKTMSHSFPQPPVTLKTRGVKVAFSTSRILLLYFFFFSFSCSLKRAMRDLWE